MTLLDVQNQLISHFCGKQTFDLSTDSAKILVEENMAGMKKELIVSALSHLVVLGIANEVNETVWILTEPLNSRNQTVSISMETANVIASVINAWLKARDINTIAVNALHIGEGNVVDLLEIISALSAEQLTSNGLSGGTCGGLMAGPN